MDSSGGEGPDFREFVRLIKRRGWILILCVVLIPAGVYLLTASRPKIFQASTLVQVQTASLDPTQVSPDFSGNGSTNIDAIASFVSTNAVSDEAARRLGLPRGSLRGAATATANSDTGFLSITATASSAQRAAAAANAFAAALNATREKRGVQRVEQAIATVQKNLEKTPKSSTPQRAQLETQLQQLQTLRAAQSQNVQVLQPAEGATQIAPHPKRNATVAVLLAVLVGLGLLLIVERADRRLRRPEDLEQLSALPFLGTIPHEAFPGGDRNPNVTEAFQTLRNSLTYFNAEDAVSSLLVCSALKGEGKTTVAVNLAIAYATFGKRVIVVDTDLRKPDLASRFGFTDRTGLSDVLAGTTRLEDALLDVPPHGHGLRVLPGGPVPPNPSAMLGSLRMASLVEELAEDADIVILDSAPILVVSDAFPLLDKVSGVLPLARLDKTPRDAIQRMVRVASSAGARLLGMIATDARAGALTGYGYGYGYGADYGERSAPTTAAPARAAESNSSTPAADRALREQR
jgi:capsular exopolysaccharide synthesis family protein